MEDDLLDALAAFWRSDNIELGGGADPEAIRAFEQRCNVVLPDDVRAYFLRLNGIHERHVDEELTAFWPIERVRSINDELRDKYDEVLPEGDHYFCFADHHGPYAVRLTADGSGPSDVVYAHSSTDFIPIAMSFSHFFRRYLGPERRFLLDPQFTRNGIKYGYRP